MTFRSVYNEERGGFGPLRAPKTYPKHLLSVETNENNEILFIDKIKRAARSGVRSNPGCAFERTRACVHSSGRAFGRSCNAVPCVFKCRCCVRPQCVRTQITAHGARLKQ
jgi:hypothetical protein